MVGRNGDFFLPSTNVTEHSIEQDFVANTKICNFFSISKIILPRLFRQLVEFVFQRRKTFHQIHIHRIDSTAYHFYLQFSRLCLGIFQYYEFSL